MMNVNVENEEGNVFTIEKKAREQYSAALPSIAKFWN